MKGAVAAGHPLTAAAGARMLEEGGNAVDACVAAAFAAWVTESPLTGPGAGGFALVVPSDGRPARWRTSSSRRRASAVRPLPKRRCMRSTSLSAVTAKRPRCSESARLRAPCPARRRGSRPSMRRTAGCRGEISRAGDRVGPGRRRGDAAAGAPARDPRSDPPAHRRGAARLQPAGRLAARAGRHLRLPDLGGTLEQIAVEGADALYRGDLAGADRAHGARGRRRA